MVLELALLVLPFFLPGYLLVNVMFPGRGSLGGEHDALYRVFLGVVLSVALTSVYGSLLIVFAAPGQVLLRPESLWTGLGVLAVAFFLAGVYRGAYPRLAPILGRSPAPSEEGPEGPDELFDRLMDITARLEAAEAAPAGGSAEQEAKRAHIDDLKRGKRQLEEEASRRA